MAEPSETYRPREAPAAEAATRIAPRRRTADQRLRIQERLTMGLTVAHIARVEQLTVRRVRQIIAEMLASREIDPPAGFVQLQIARLSEAMIVARTMMMQGNPTAIRSPHRNPVIRPLNPQGSWESPRKKVASHAKFPPGFRRSLDFANAIPRPYGLRPERRLARP
jgi:hypothetical protein